MFGVRKSILECWISSFLQRIHIGKLRVINLWNSMQICVFYCITSAKILIFNISCFCFLLLNLIALCFACSPVIMMINNAFSVYLLQFICDTDSAASPSFLRRLPLPLKSWVFFVFTPIHILLQDCLFSIFSGFLDFLTHGFRRSERWSFKVIKVVFLKVRKTACLTSYVWEWSEFL